MITVAQTLPALNALSDYMLSLSYSSCTDREPGPT